MADLSTMPEEINVVHYGGDTLTIHIQITAQTIGGRTFFAQVRQKATNSRIDATFGVIVTAEGADIVLSSEDSKRLSARGVYEGVWDVQLAEADGSDPVTTLAYGDMVINPDVTRVAA